MKTKPKLKKTASPDMKLADGKYAFEGIANVQLNVRGGSRVFEMRVTVKDQGPETFSLGPWSLVNDYETVNREADWARDLARRGISPKAELRKRLEAVRDQAAKDAAQLSYRDFVMSLEHKLPKEGPESKPYKRHIRYAITSLGEYADLKPGQITLAHLKEQLEPRWHQRGVVVETLKLVSMYLRLAKVLGHIKEPGWVNPATLGTLQLVIKQPLREAEPRKALKLADLPDLLMKLRQGRNDCGAPLAYLIVELIILTALRSSEVTRLLWSYIDMDARLIRIPRDEMKGDMIGVAKEVTHFEVPITPAMARVLDRAKFLAPPKSANDPVFPSPSSADGFYHSSTVLDVLESCGFRSDEQKITIHGFRSVFVGWANTLTDPVLNDDGKPVMINGKPRTKRRFDRRDVQMCLAHVEKDKTDRVYDRMLPVEPRLPIMEDWSEFCGVGQVVSLDAARAAQADVYGPARKRVSRRR